MDERKFSFRYMKESREGQIIFCVVSMFLLVCIYSVCMKQLERRYVILEDNFSCVYQIDSIEENNGKIQIIGWAFSLEQDAELESYEIILRDEETGKNIYPRMKYEKRKDVNNYFACDYDYSASGFKASVSSRRIAEENKVYRIILKQVGNRNAILTNVYYANGEMLFVHPNDFKMLDIIGTDFEAVVQNGILRVYRPEEGIYVYQYNDNLYWIVEEKNSFVIEDFLVQYQLYTTQPHKLPSERIENNWLWGNESFSFISNEILGTNTGKYRVTVCSLPQDYAVTSIVTGNYMDEWVWRVQFRPWYEFED